MINRKPVVYTFEHEFPANPTGLTDYISVNSQSKPVIALYSKGTGRVEILFSISDFRKGDNIRNANEMYWMLTSTADLDGEFSHGVIMEHQITAFRLNIIEANAPIIVEVLV